jgi:ribonuclease J
MISSNRNYAFEDQIFNINKITKGRNLALMVGIGNVGINKGFTNPYHRTAEFFSNILSENEDGRTLIACNNFDFYTIMTIASICAE